MANSILFDLLTLVQISIVNRGLPGISSANVVIFKVPLNNTKDLPKPPTTYPAIIVAPWGKETMHGGTNLRDDICYPIVVAILAADNADQKIHFNQYLTWRASIKSLFIQQNLPNGVTATINGTSYGSGQLAYLVKVDPLDIVDRNAWRDVPIWASGLVLKCYSREPRG